VLLWKSAAKSGSYADYGLILLPTGGTVDFFNANLQATVSPMDSNKNVGLDVTLFPTPLPGSKDSKKDDKGEESDSNIWKWVGIGVGIILIIVIIALIIKKSRKNSPESYNRKIEKEFSVK
jgi:hypothetical protein